MLGIYPLHHHAGVWGDDVEVCIMYNHANMNVYYRPTMAGQISNLVYCNTTVNLRSGS